MANNYFNLTLDTIAPSGGITTGSSSIIYINDQTSLTVDTGGATFMKVWFNGEATGTKSDPEYPSTWSASAATVTSQFTNNGYYYYHAVLMDDLGNESIVYNTNQICYDTDKPTVNSVKINNGATVTTDRVVTVEVTFSNTGSAPLGAINIYGDWNDEAPYTWNTNLSQSERDAGKVQRTIKLSGTGPEDITKNIRFTVTNLTGTISENTAASRGLIILDTEFITGDIAIYNREKTHQIETQWINYRPITVRLALGSATSSDVVGYKIWGDICAEESGTLPTPEPQNFTTVAIGTNPIDYNTYLTPGDSETKTVNAKVIDDAGNVTTLTSVTVKYDHTEPIVTLALETGDHAYVSKIDGYKTKVVVPTVISGLAGAASYQWKLDGSNYPSGSGTGDPEDFTFSSDNMGTTEGNKVVTLVVTDNAGNVGTSSGLTLILDTTAPSCTGITMDAWYNSDDADHTTYQAFSACGVTAVATDSSSGMIDGGTMECWRSNTATDTTVPSGTSVISYSANPTHGQVNWGTPLDGNAHYVHIRYTDKVGNSAIYHSSAFGIDRTAPSPASVTFPMEIYRTQAATVNLSASDVVSTTAKFKIWGDILDSYDVQITESTAVWENFSASKSVKLKSNADPSVAETKYVYVKFKDVAGNISTTVSDSATLNESSFAAGLELWNAADTARLGNYTKEAEFKMHATKPTGSTDALKYQVYGNFSFDEQTSVDTQYDPSPSSSAWKDFTYTGSYLVISDVFFTTANGNKDVYIRLMDTSFNISEPTRVQVTYDTTPPEATISDVDHNNISKVHAFRRTTSEVLTTYCDQTKFTLTPSDVIQAYKVCAYLTREAANNGSAADTPIPQEGDGDPGTHTSVNMHRSGLSTSDSIICTIAGADYEEALGGTGKDGLHYVVAYVQDLAGNWSASAVIPV